MPTVSRLILLASLLGVLLLVAAAQWLVIAFPDGYREHRAYLTEQRPVLDFRFDELSQNWSESDLKGRFRGVVFHCYGVSYPQSREDRNCFVDIRSHNGAPAMIAQFFLAGNRLSRASLLVPWWHHATMLQAIKQTYGLPDAAQTFFHDGLRLYGWQLQDGSAIFYNRDMPFNPLAANAILWNSANRCREDGCFTGVR